MEQTPAPSFDTSRVGPMNAHLSADDLSGMLDGRLPPTRREAVEAHLAVCADCRAELVSASEILESAPPVRVKRTKWVAGSTLAAAAALVLLILPRATRRGVHEPASDLTRHGSTPTGIAVVDPAPSAEVARDSIRFVWRGQPGATYRLFVTDSVGLPLFNTTTTDTTVVPPTDLQLVPGVHYFWYVDALRPDGSQASTLPTGFSTRAR